MTNDVFNRRARFRFGLAEQKEQYCEKREGQKKGPERHIQPKFNWMLLIGYPIFVLSIYSVIPPSEIQFRSGKDKQCASNETGEH